MWRTTWSFTRRFTRRFTGDSPDDSPGVQARPASPAPAPPPHAWGSRSPRARATAPPTPPTRGRARRREAPSRTRWAAAASRAPALRPPPGRRRRRRLAGRKWRRAPRNSRCAGGRRSPSPQHPLPDTCSPQKPILALPAPHVLLRRLKARCGGEGHPVPALTHPHVRVLRARCGGGRASAAARERVHGERGVDGPTLHKEPSRASPAAAAESERARGRGRGRGRAKDSLRGAEGFAPPLHLHLPLPLSVRTSLVGPCISSPAR